MYFFKQFLENSAHAERICTEILYLDGLSGLHGDKYNDLLLQAGSHVLKAGFTAESVARAEEILAPLAPLAKS